jgi:hypothetical protein
MKTKYYGLRTTEGDIIGYDMQVDIERSIDYVLDTNPSIPILTTNIRVLQNMLSTDGHGSQTYPYRRFSLKDKTLIIYEFNLPVRSK